VLCIGWISGEDEKVAKLTSLIHDLDERATELDKARTSTISSISYINERNRKKNVEEAEKAILVSGGRSKVKGTDGKVRGVF
jgi:RNA polymerase-associated protein RTF1